MCMVNVLISLLFVLLHIKLLPFTCIFPQIEARHLHHSPLKNILMKNVHRDYITTENQFMMNDGQVVNSNDQSSLDTHKVNHCDHDGHDDDGNNKNNSNDDDDDDDDDDGDDDEPYELPIPTDISVVLASWTPPSIRVSWTFPTLNETCKSSNKNSNSSTTNHQLKSFHHENRKNHTNHHHHHHQVHNGKRSNHINSSLNSDTANSKVDYLHNNNNNNSIHYLLNQPVERQNIPSYSDHLSLKQQGKILLNCTSDLRNDLQASNDQENNSNMIHDTSNLDISSNINKSKCHSSGLSNSIGKLEAFRIIYHPIKTR